MTRPIDRRTFLKTLAAAGLVVASPVRGVAGRALGGLATAGASRVSRLSSSAGRFLVHSDLHNHSVVSGDALGDTDTAYQQMRAAGLDVASLTEHAISGKTHGDVTCPDGRSPCGTFVGIGEEDWERLRALADRANDPGSFVAIRGFEWSNATIGHLNVWFSEQWTDSLQNAAFITPRGAAELDRVTPVPSDVADMFEQAPETATIRLFYEWLASDPGRPFRGGGADGIACFNHPNEFGDFEAFLYDPAVAPQIVSCEALNADRDFFWHDLDKGKPNPLNACLNAGWRVGFLGVSDEHSTTYGRPGLARGGLWVAELTRAGVRDALTSRRTFATFEPGLRLDASANGVPMGGTVPHARGPIQVLLDIAAGPAWVGKPLVVEVIRPGVGAPVLAGVHEVTVRGDEEPAIAFTVEANIDDGDWFFLRICDRERAPHPNATEPYASHGGAVAYASPFFLAAPS